MDSIIFDVDGTIWDSTQSVADSWNKAIREHSDLDLTLDPVSLSRVFGKTMTEIADALFPALDTEARMKLLDACYAEENRYLEDHPGLLYDGVAGTIRNLSLRYPLYIVSNCQCGYIEVMLKTSGLAPYIKDHLCFGETLRPKGETIRMLMEKNGLKSPVYVGDTQGDADACKTAGIPFIFAEYGFGDVPDAATRIQRFSDLEKICL
ncbi:HAD family hydrolase [Mediterraneibacter catenae]|jgi:phosphoglycolate phosphatase|uniref:HAD family hydrolase n=1 Tax=Mediterraneibacter catenae TaxID=2594882 RepID=A0A5M9HYW3_9FIRM|nr:HAD family hydrolase [Mediterraneibacter catenae]KAA8500726.1 HAD family hydrolase [Mediterraneibacter catenae]